MGGTAAPGDGHASGRIRWVNPGLLRDLPARARQVSKKLVKAYDNIIEADIPAPIHVGLVDGSMYAVNDLELVAGLRRASVKRIGVHVTAYGSMRDLLGAHVQANFRAGTIDPIMVRDVIGLMVEKGRRNHPIYNDLQLDRQPDLLRAIRARLSPKACKVLLGITGAVSAESTHTALPAHYAIMLSQLPAGRQYRAALQLQDHTLYREDGTWLDPASVKLILEMHRGKNYDDVSAEDLAKGYVDRIRERGTRLPTGSILNMRTKLEESDIVYVKLDGAGYDLFMSTSTGRCAKIDDPDRIYKIDDVNGKARYIIPDSMMEHLGADGPVVYISMFETVKEFVETCGGDASKGSDCPCVVIRGSESSS